MLKKILFSLFLVSSYAVFAQQSNAESELESAVYANDAKRIRAAVKAGANPNGGNYWGHYLGIAATSGNLEAIKALVGLGADVNYATRGGWTAAMGAADNGHLAVLQYLVSKKADLNAKTRMGRSILMRASYQGKTKIVQYLITKKVNINDTDFNGVTALILAAQAGHLDTVKVLLAAGADRNAETQDKRTALSIVHSILEQDAHTNGTNTQSETYKRYKPIEALLKMRTMPHKIEKTKKSPKKTVRKGKK
ncbi:MAG TPA: ankyrin repeat domain-containing protein [Turneriella sp.]|nr:ankyrin repeat domain-containing protein [Turneriella sp.]